MGCGTCAAPGIGTCADPRIGACTDPPRPGLPFERADVGGDGVGVKLLRGRVAHPRAPATIDEHERRVPGGDREGAPDRGQGAARAGEVAQAAGELLAHEEGLHVGGVVAAPVGAERERGDRPRQLPERGLERARHRLAARARRVHERERDDATAVGAQAHERTTLIAQGERAPGRARGLAHPVQSVVARGRGGPRRVGARARGDDRGERRGAAGAHRESESEPCRHGRRP